MPVNGKIFIIPVPENITGKLVNFTEFSGINKILHHFDKRIITVLEYRKQRFASLFNTSENFKRFAYRKRKRFFANYVRRIRQFRNVADMARMQSGRGENTDNIQPFPVEFTVVSNIRDPEQFACGLRFFFIFITNVCYFNAVCCRNCFDMTLGNTSATDQTYFLHISILLN